MHKQLKEETDKKMCRSSRRSCKKRKNCFIPNVIPCSLERLSILLRFFDREIPLGIPLVHVVSPSEVMCSAQKAVDVTHLIKVLSTHFLSRHEEKRHVENNFKMISIAEFDNCTRCVDRILSWVFKTDEKDAIVSEVGITKKSASEK